MAKQLQLVDQPITTVPPEVYDKNYVTQLNGVHRVFFHRLTNALNAVIGQYGGQYVDCPNALYFNTAAQVFTNPNTAYPVVFDQTYLQNGLSLASSSQVTALVSGVYNFQYSGQLVSKSSSAKTFYLWIRRNTTDISYSTHAYTLSASNQYLQVGWNFDIDLQTGDYIELRASVDDVNLRLTNIAAGVYPSAASSVLTVNFIAPLPATLPVLP